mmetsp:Transcript_128672/g.274656  ORF Transcript_128672/g.274656 Transcript_128672/m.274656 type:complete len:237 (-) Transcript_128672:118-828(-)
MLRNELSSALAAVVARPLTLRNGAVTEGASELVDLLESLPAGLLRELLTSLGLLLLHLQLRRELRLQLLIVIGEAQPQLRKLRPGDEMHRLREHHLRRVRFQALCVREKTDPRLPLVGRLEQVLTDDGQRQHHVPEDQRPRRHSSPDSKLQEDIEGAIHQVNASQLQKARALEERSSIGHSELAEEFLHRCDIAGEVFGLQDGDVHRSVGLRLRLRRWRLRCLLRLRGRLRRRQRR